MWDGGGCILRGVLRAVLGLLEWQQHGGQCSLEAGLLCSVLPGIMMLGRVGPAGGAGRGAAARTLWAQAHLEVPCRTARA